MPVIDVRSIIEGALKLMDPWDLTLLINGQEFATREPSAVVVAGLRRLEELDNDAAFGLLDELFDPPARPPLRTWYADGAVTDVDLVTMVMVVQRAVGERHSKNLAAVARAINPAAAATRKTS